uniref:Probable ATP-dependent transporter ycf16 n=1 Tax=Compsopogon caeruleus TaxID=31354 RepID=A0A6T6CZ33_9RHOD
MNWKLGDQVFYDYGFPVFTFVYIFFLYILLNDYLPTGRDRSWASRFALYREKFQIMMAKADFPTFRREGISSQLTTLRLLWNNFSNPKALIPALVCSMIMTLMEFGIAQIDGELLNTLVSGENPALMELILTRFSLTALLFGSHVLHGVLFARARHFTSARVKVQLYGEILAQKFECFQLLRPGYYAAMLENDAPRVVESSFRVMDSMTRACFHMGLGGISSIRQDFTITILTLCLNIPFLVYVIPLSSALTTAIYGYYDQCAKISGSFSAETLSLRAVRSIQICGLQSSEIPRYQAANDYFLDALRVFNLLETVLVYCGDTLHWLLDALLVTFGALRISQGRMSAGQVVAFRGGIHAMTRGMREATSISTDLSRIRPIMDRLLLLLSPPCQNTVDEGFKRIRFLGRIQFCDVSLRDPTQDSHFILQKISFEANPGDLIAVVGPSGAGKSSLLSLVVGLFEPSDGSILIDNKDVQHLDKRQLCTNIGFIEQETVLFNRSVSENICLHGDEDMGDIEEAAKTAFAHEFIINLPDGYETILGESGCKLSVGQRQRIGIARAILTNPAILICDEPTSHLDSESETAVHAAMMNLAVGRTTFLVAHRLLTVRNANTIIFLEDGKIREVGSHATLMEQKGRYWDFVQGQLSGIIFEGKKLTARALDTAES